MAKTRDQLIQRAAERLQVAQAGQPLAAEDRELIDANVVPVLRDLAARRVCDIVNPNNIPDELFLGLADCLAAACAEDFGATFDGAAAEVRLRAATARYGYSGAPVRTDYF